MLFTEPYWTRIPYILAGVDTVAQVGDLVKNFGGQKPLVVTDLGVINAGLLDIVQKPLEKAGIKFGVFDKCEPDAPVGIIQNCAKLAKDVDHDVIIGLGGGSCLDTAKVSAIAAAESNIPRNIVSWSLKSRSLTRKLHSIMIPTTAGSGAEVSPVAVVTGSDGFKNGVFECLTDMAIVDPMMTLNLPAEITADTGIDALSHSLERWLHPKSSLLCDTLGEMVIKTIYANLSRCILRWPEPS